MTAGDARLDAIRARLDAATPGPWGKQDCVEVDHEGTYELAHVIAADLDEPETAVQGIAMGLLRHDADLIAHAPADLLYLLAELREAREALTRVEAEVSATEELAEIVVGDDLQAGLRMEARGIRAAVAAANGDGE